MLGLRFRVLGSPLEADETGMRMWVSGRCAFCGFVRQTTKAEKENKRHTAQATKSDVPRKRTMEVAMAMAMATCLPADRKNGRNGKGKCYSWVSSTGRKTSQHYTNTKQIFENKKKFFFNLKITIFLLTYCVIIVRYS